MRLTWCGQRTFGCNIRNGPNNTTCIRTFKGHSVFLDGVNGSIGNDRLPSLQDGCNVNLLPLDWDLTEIFSDDENVRLGAHTLAAV